MCAFSEDHYRGNSSPAIVSFELNGGNPYRGSDCTVEGDAYLSAPGTWSFKGSPDDFDQDGKACQVTLKRVSPREVQVDVDGCNDQCGMGADVLEGVYQSSQCGDYTARHRKFTQLHASKRFAEALKLGLEMEAQCARERSQNTIGALRSDLAFLHYKLGHKKECLAVVNEGIENMHKASEGLASLEDSLRFYASGELKSKNVCKEAIKPGCEIYKERIAIYKRLTHNRALCSK